jgi:hypothetical protein
MSDARSPTLHIVFDTTEIHHMLSTHRLCGLEGRQYAIRHKITRQQMISEIPGPACFKGSAHETENKGR